MGKQFTKEDVILNKKEALKSLNKLLESYINDTSGNHLKKANLISYWIKNYVQYICYEENFDPAKNISYKRGNIVKVNFGFNVGSEYGGLHYAVILDNHNSHNSPVVTVIPLTSIKDTKPVHSNSVYLGNELYKLLKIKYDTVSKTLKEERDEIMGILEFFDHFFLAAIELTKELNHEEKASDGLQQKITDALDSFNNAKRLQNTLEEKNKHNKEEQEYLNKIGQEISQMKEGSIALVNQITTISKMRIYDPKNAKGVLSSISLSETSMEKINEKMKYLYIFK